MGLVNGGPSLAETILEALALEADREVDLRTLTDWLRVRGHHYKSGASIRLAIRRLTAAELVRALEVSGAKAGRRATRLALTARAQNLLQRFGPAGLCAELSARSALGCSAVRAPSQHAPGDDAGSHNFENGVERVTPPARAC